MQTQPHDVPVDYALVLQQINEAGEEDLTNLSETLRLSRNRLLHILEALRHKGLISVMGSSYGAVMIRLSRKGQKYISQVWPAMPQTA